MKKTKKLIAVSAALACITMLCACGNIDESESSSKQEATKSTAAETTAEVTQESESSADESVSETPSEEISGVVSEADSSESQESDESSANSSQDEENQERDDYGYISYVDTLIGALDYIDKIGASNIPFDDGATYVNGNGATYTRVANTQFSSTADLKEYMESYLTDEMINDRYSAILGTDTPLYIDHDGELYGIDAPKAGGFAWTNENTKLLDETDSSFTIIAEYDNFGVTDTLAIQVVKDDDGNWKTNSFSYGL